MKLLQRNVTILNVLLLSGIYGATAAKGFSASQAPKRLKANIDDSQTFVLKGNTRPLIELGLAQDQGQVSGTRVLPRMAIHFSMTAAQLTDLANLEAALQNRRSPQFRKFLTPEQYADRFGLNAADIEKVNAWLENSGFSNLEVARSRTWVTFSGTAAQAQAAFHTSIHNYALNGQTHFANATDPQLPKALQNVAQSVRGLHNFQFKPHLRLKPRFTSSISGNNFLTPDDWATIYNVKPLYGQGYDGTGVSIAVVGQTDIALTDLQAFRTASGLAAKDPTIIQVGTIDPGIQSASGDEGESDLDLEWAGAIAKNANIIFYTADSVQGNGVTDAIAYAINDNKAAVLSTSYGLCEGDLSLTDFNTQNALLQQATVQGITVVAAAGDAGAADCDTGNVANQGLQVDFPAVSPYVTGVGGTTLNEGTGSYWSTTNNSSNGSALSYIPEIVWNDGNQSATGGGVSARVAKPTWQTGTGVPSDGVRDVPDISFAASPNHDGYLMCSDGWCTNGFRNASSNLDVSGGTSTGPPTLAGIVALLVQKTSGRLGNINPNIYSLGAISTNAFHDVTSGNNIVTCQIGSPNCSSTGQMGYSAAAGYDLASGWGSLDAFNFVEQWQGDFQLTVSPSSLIVSRGSSGSATVTVTPQNNFDGAVSFSCSVASPLTNVTCSIPGTVTGSGSATITVTAGSSATLSLWRRLGPFSATRLGWLAALLAMAMISLLAKKRPLPAWSAAFALILVLGAASCGGGSSSGSSSNIVVSQTGVVTVTAVSGGLTNTATFTVTAQ